VVGFGDGDVVVGLGVVVGGLGLVLVGFGVAEVLVGFGFVVVSIGLADFMVGLACGEVVVGVTAPADVGTEVVAAIDMLGMTLAADPLVARVLGTAAIKEAAAAGVDERLGAAPVLLLDPPQALTTTATPKPAPITPNVRVRETLRMLDSGGRGATRLGHSVHYG
jgi:hypothetical protein